MNQIWYVYVLLSEKSNNTYVGITTDLNRRLKQHNGLLNGGAKYTKANRPWKFGKILETSNRSEAQKLEYLIKQKRGLKRLED